MAFVAFDEFGDLVAGVLRDLGPPNIQQIAQSKTNYELFSRWFSPKNRNNVKLHQSYGLQRQFINRLPDTAAHVGLIDPDNVSMQDVVDQLQVTFVHAAQGWGVVYQHVLATGGETEIFDAVRAQRDACMINLVEEIENKAWAAPASSSDKKNPWGVAYWIVKNATTGFNGGAASGHTTVAGVSLTDSPLFKNYTFTYTAGASGYDGFAKTDAIPSMRRAMMECNFQSPIPGNDYTQQTGRYCLYVGTDLMAKAELIGEQQNENIGRDLAPKQYGVGMLTFRGYDLRRAPALDSDTTYPIYGIDHSTFEVHGLKGDFFRESRKDAPNQHNVVQHFVDVSYNFCNIDRRRNFVGYAV